MEPVYDVPLEPWRPGQPVQDTTLLCDIAAVLAFGQSDNSFAEIAELLSRRNCNTVRDWQTWTKGEFLMLVKSCSKLKKNRHAYLACFQSATGYSLEVEIVKDEAGPLVKVKKQSGGDTTSLSRKQAASETFNPSKWLPDLRVYEGVPKQGNADYIDDTEEKLYLDKLWLAAQVRLA